MNYFILGFFLVLLAVIVGVVIKYRERIRVFKGEVALEMNKVSWPAREEVSRSVALIFVVVLLMTIVIGVIDALFVWITRAVF